MRVLLVPDSFKGTMDSVRICEIMERAVLRNAPDAQVVKIPVADGGEGSVDCFLAAASGEKVRVRVRGPLDEEMDSFYGVLKDGTAVIEMAACAGLPLVEGRMAPDVTTTYGVGQMMVDAAQKGCARMIVGLGGSATNDMATGAAAGAGVRFYDAAGRAFTPAGGTLSDIARIDMSGLHPALKKLPITAMCDIDNPLYGENGAAYVFAPQKGADANMVRRLDAQLRAGADAVARELGVDMAAMSGAGAAGGMGGGMVAFFGARLQMGIDAVLDTVGFDELLKDADLVLTGEGKIDSQSLRGKVVIGVARRCKAAGVPVAAIVGGIDEGVAAAYDEGVSGIFSINRLPMAFEQAKAHSEENLFLTVDNLLRFVMSATKGFKRS